MLANGKISLESWPFKEHTITGGLGASQPETCPIFGLNGITKEMTGVEPSCRRNNCCHWNGKECSMTAVKRMRS